MDKKYTIEDLLEILKLLRGENGCPWDRVQTHESLKKTMIEETYEAIDALDSGDDQGFSNELGDVLLQVAFHAILAQERGAFDFDDVVREICTKLITRHTHVFGSDKAVGAEEALGNWEKNKKKEKGLKTNEALLRDVPLSLPALMRAEKVLKKAVACGYQPKNMAEEADIIREKSAALIRLSETGKTAEIEEEYGNILLSAVRLGRHLKLTPEVSLADAVNRFIIEFTESEKSVQ